jgi:ubiquinone/menaquinone biosynthesis C-methylase UbiE
MKPNYKNWMPKGMIWSFAAGAAVALALTLVIGVNWLKIILLIITLVLAVVTVWTMLMYRAFSYDGKRQMSRQIIEGVAEYVKLPKGGRCLDVGCGSGALANAVAKRNPQGTVTGIDRWGAEYASFSKKLCEDNALAEGVAERTSFAKGDAQKLDFPDGTFDAVTSNYVYHNIPSRDRQAILLETLRVLKKGGAFAIHDIFSREKYGDMQAFVKKLRDLGYERVELIPTDNGKFMSPWEARWMTLSGSALLVGKK